MSNGLTSPRLAMLQRVVDDETCELGVRLEALSRLKNLELDMSAATPEPKPVPNNHPAIADVVAAELVALHEPMAREVATDVMARKAFGLAKYGTPLQPFNGRNTLNDLYQELVDAVKYARVALYEASYLKAQTREAEDIYESLRDLTIEVKTLMDRNANNGAANAKGNEARIG
jgi:hypothetical protein